MISIIMPTYNSAPWLEASIKSVIAQTMTDWELIAIDDGSTDSSASLISLLAESDARIRLIRVQHQGVANVRNLGIAEARGELVAFIDSDDLWPTWNLEYLHRLLNETGAEITCGEFIMFPDGKERMAIDKCANKEKTNKTSVKIINGIETVRESLYQKGVNSSLWGKLFRKELLTGLKMVSGEIYEDLDLFYQIALRAKKVAVSSLPVYLYRQRAGSILHTFGLERLVVLDVTERMCSHISERYPSLAEAALDRRFSANYNMLQLLVIHAKDEGANNPNKSFFDKKKKEIREFLSRNALKELKNRNVRIKNRLGALLFLLMPSHILDLILSLRKS